MAEFLGSKDKIGPVTGAKKKPAKKKSAKKKKC